MASQSNSVKRVLGPVFGVKMLITAASLAGTVGGWLLLTSQAPAASAIGAAPAPATSSAVTFNLSPLPTIVPAPSSPSSPAPVFNSAPIFIQPMPFAHTRSSR
jgi:hypothetical protein